MENGDATIAELSQDRTAVKLSWRRPWLVLVLFALAAMGIDSRAADTNAPTARPPKDDADLRYWVENMAHHRFSLFEMSEATGLPATKLNDVLRTVRLRQPAGLKVLPYPGGRHPRQGFRDGAIDPQRETKVSVFLPWEDSQSSYVVVDVPEAIWSNLGLTYLAHTHIPTVWDKKGVRLDPLEWNRSENGSLAIERALPNGIRFGVTVETMTNWVKMDMWLHNGTTEKLSDLRVQMCVMLRAAIGFDEQSNDNKVFRAPYAACRSRDGKRWIITAWETNHRTWGNPPCPCVHSDPKFPDCAPGETKLLRGGLWFFEGGSIDDELRRLDATGWRISAK